MICASRRSGRGGKGWGGGRSDLEILSFCSLISLKVCLP